MIKIEIKPSQVAVDERTGEKDGKKWVSREQKGYIYLGGDYPELFVFPLAEGQPPYEAGFYELTEQCLVVGKYKKLDFSRAFVFRPVK
ncbi:TPA: DNA-binding protein [Escherichia coli]|nr:DNA-binding protein [Escherichia coli]HEL8044732.1 DNA-binding protein [Escherichia coli]HEL8054290.1 DNA-binding protein [Escherichia coli]HEL8059108.1 DNA-binding protein [Escherichia coli]HEL8103456.1 DNA-binding protein [Escherichia coli]